MWMLATCLSNVIHSIWRMAFHNKSNRIRSQIPYIHIHYESNTHQHHHHSTMRFDFFYMSISYNHVEIMIQPPIDKFWYFVLMLSHFGGEMSTEFFLAHIFFCVQLSWNEDIRFGKSSKEADKLPHSVSKPTIFLLQCFLFLIKYNAFFFCSHFLLFHSNIASPWSIYLDYFRFLCHSFQYKYNL